MFYVFGACVDSYCIADMIIDNWKLLDEIIVTLDSHHVIHIQLFIIIIVCFVSNQYLNCLCVFYAYFACCSSLVTSLMARIGAIHKAHIQSPSQLRFDSKMCATICGPQSMLPIRYAHSITCYALICFAY